MTHEQKPSFIQQLKKFFASDRRSADRQPLTNLAAHFWTGAAPQKHEVRDISPTGLYLKTEERWYPGTVVTMTLQKEDQPENSTEGIITVQSKAVRTGTDGVGLAFVLPESTAERNETQELGTVANRKSLLHFLKKIRPSN